MIRYGGMPRKFVETDFRQTLRLNVEGLLKQIVNRWNWNVVILKKSYLLTAQKLSLTFFLCRQQWYFHQNADISVSATMKHNWFNALHANIDYGLENRSRERCPSVTIIRLTATVECGLRIVWGTQVVCMCKRYTMNYKVYVGCILNDTIKTKCRPMAESDLHKAYHSAALF